MCIWNQAFYGSHTDTVPMAGRTARPFFVQVIHTRREQTQGTSVDATRVHRKRTRFQHHGVRPPRHTGHCSAGRDGFVFGKVIKHHVIITIRFAQVFCFRFNRHRGRISDPKKRNLLVRIIIEGL